MSKDTLFTNDSGAAGGAIDYVKDAFTDISLPANSNSGFSTSILKNPLSYSYTNDDCPRYGVKTLFVKDMVLLEDRSKWFQDRPTYEIIWTESFPAVKAYCYGFARIGKTTDGAYVALNAGTSGFGVGGVIRRAGFLFNATTTSTVDTYVDGVLGTVFTVGAAPGLQISSRPRKQLLKVHSATNETKDIHDYQVRPGAPTSGADVEQQVYGVVVYFENTGYNIDCFPGTTYVDKSKITTNSISVLNLPTYSNQIGGRSVIYKTNNSGYSSVTNPIPTLQSAATGTNGANTLNLTTGTGASFKAGYGVISSFGTSYYLGSIVSMSTDVATVAPVLGFAISGPIYRAWSAGTSLQINPSLMTLGYSYNTNEKGFSNSFFDEDGRYSVWGFNFGTSQLSTGTTLNVTYISPLMLVPLTGGTGLLQIDGYFSALELETFGVTGSFQATFGINGIPCVSINQGVTGLLKKTIVTDMGPGWNSVQIGIGASTARFGIKAINFYQNSRSLGVSSGLLSEFDTLQTFINSQSVNATTIAPGTYRRQYADALGFSPSTWTRSIGATAAGGIMYSTSTAGATFAMQFFGKNYALIGAAGAGTGTSFVASLDGNTIAGVSAGNFFNQMNIGATEGFHTLAISQKAGTLLIAAFDYTRTQGEFKSLQNPIIPASNKIVDPDPEVLSEVWVTGSVGVGSTNSRIWKFSAVQNLEGSAITYVPDAALGDSFVINEDGIYAFQSDVGGASTFVQIVGWTLNETGVGSTTVDTIPRQFLLSWNLQRGTAAGGVSCETGGVKVLRKGDILRVHTYDNVSDEVASPYARVTQIRKIRRKNV